MAIAPVGVDERIEVLDVVRGAALFGILAVNLAFFTTPVYTIVLEPPPWTSPADRVAAWAIRFFAEGKFYTMFSFLFGLGLYLQIRRAEERGVPFVPLYLRRLAVLLLIGLIHAVLIWVGDILVSYAVLGVVLLAFRRRRPGTLLVWAAICWLVPLLLHALSVLALTIGRMDPATGAEITRSLAESTASARQLAEQASRAYAQGSYAEVTAQRLRDLAFLYSVSFLFAPSILALFLLGLFAGMRGIFTNLPAHRTLVRRVWLWGGLLGMPGNAGFATALELTGRSTSDPLALVAAIGQAVGTVSLCFFYIGGLTLLMQDPAWQHRLRPLAAVGRMALTNYLMQSVICTLVFNGYGLGLYGTVGPAPGLALTVALYAIQVPVSAWWLRRFQFGPMEWLWRSLTYLRWQPLRHPPPLE